MVLCKPGECGYVDFPKAQQDSARAGAARRMTVFFLAPGRVRGLGQGSASSFRMELFYREMRKHTQFV